MLLYPFIGFAQQSAIITKRFLSVEDGLSSREVNCAIQDQYGYMWFGTRNGLNRFDGKTFLSFTKQQHGLRQNKIIQIGTDYNNLLFIMYGQMGVQHTCTGQIDVLDLVTQEVKSLSSVFPDLPFKEEDVFWISNDGGKSLNFVVAHPYSYWKYENNRFVKIQNLSAWPEPPSANRAYAAWGYHYFFSKNFVVLRDSKQVYFLSGDTSFTKHPSFAGEKDYGILGLDKNENLIVTGWGDNVITSFNTLSANGTFTPNVTIPCIERLKNVPASINFSQGGGAAAFITHSPTSLLLTNFAELYQVLDAKELAQYPNLEIDQVINDNQHNYWIITSHGVIYAKIKKNRFTHHFIQDYQTTEGEKNQVRGIYSNGEGTIYANLWDKLFIKTPDNTTSSYKAKSILYPISVAGEKVYSCGTVVNVFDKKSGTFGPFTAGNAGPEIWSSYVTDNNRMLLGTGAGISILDLNTKEVKKVKPAGAHIPEPKNCYRFFKQDTTIWAVTENGLYLLNSTGTALVNYYGTNTGEKNELPFASLHDAYLDAEGIFWLATNGEGLYRWNRTENKFSHFNITSGFLSDVLYRIEEDNFQHLWISTDNGLIHFNKTDFSSHVYRKRDGLSHNEFNRISSFKDKNGIIYFGGMSGINSFDPMDFVNETFIINTPLRITFASKFSSKENKLINFTSALLKENKITLNPGDRFLDLTFRLLDFGEDAHLYAYLIEGLDKQWSFIKDGSLRLSGLPYGNYHLLLKGQNASGRWSRSEIKIPIEVLKPFYLKPWFYISVVVFLIMLITFFMKLRVYNLEKINLLLEKKVEKRTEELKLSLEQKEILFQEVHHRVKNNLQVIASLLQLQNSKTDNEETRMAILESQNRVFSISFIHQNLYKSGSMQGVEMRSFVNELTGHIRNIFHTPDLLIEVKNSISNVVLDIDTAVPFGLLINELMTNSYKYAFQGKKSGTITLSLVEKGEGIYYFIYEDDGIGMPPGYKIEKAETLGMRLIHQLSRQLAGRFTYMGGQGIKFELEFKDSEARNKIL